ncbi:MAG: (2Fe-2S)-binding protein [Clostridia bacterium]|nr:(2Fe-2S)-binding protein [Clostridia bacterium]
MNEVKVTINVNGQQVTATVAPEESLLDFLRNRAGATEVKCGCNKGDCGTCTVVLDGQTVKSCLVLAAQADNKQVLTVKGLEKEQLMQDLQVSFANHGAVQCGFCTPGMLVTAKTFLEKNPQPSRQEIREALSGNLCRCTGYQKIVDAVAAVAAGKNDK